MEFCRHEYWSGFPFPPPGDLPHLGFKPGSLALQILYCLSHQGSSLPASHPRVPKLSPLRFYSLGKSVCGVTIGNLRDVGLIPGSGRSPGGGHGKWPQYPCLGNPMDRAAWWATVHGIAKSQTRLKWLSGHSCTCCRKSHWNDKVIDNCLSYSHLMYTL